ncbi:MAG: hypothetical protein KJP00_14760 [Bacteroidia bacterium]|nr:hypothetical protein [Bacteroidia bacterium]
MTRLLMIFTFLTLSAQCKSDKPQETTNTETSVEETDLPLLPSEDLQNLYANATHVDYTFYHYSFSMSYDNQKSIRSVLNFVNQNSSVHDVNCAPLCRMIFLQNGQIIMEAELFVSENCAHYVWYLENQKKYANVMSPQGKQHYLQIINQFTK